MTAPPARAPERGSVSVWLAMATFVMILMVGLAVDLTGQVHAQQHARTVAAQAARAGGQELNAPRAVRGLGVRANPRAAAQAARAYLAASDVDGSVSVQGAGTRLVVTTSDTYSTRFLSIIGLRGMTVTGIAEARLARVVDGGER